MASAEEGVKSENPSIQSNNSSESSKPSHPPTTNQLNNPASSKVKYRFPSFLSTSSELVVECLARRNLAKKWENMVVQEGAEARNNNMNI